MKKIIERRGAERLFGSLVASRLSILDPDSIKSGNDPDCNFFIRNLGLDPDPDWIRIQ
jgi:hypothetical protein